MYPCPAEIQNRTNYQIENSTGNRLMGNLNITISSKLEAFSWRIIKALAFEALVTAVLIYYLFFFNRDLKPENILLDSLVSMQDYSVFCVLSQNWPFRVFTCWACSLFNIPLFIKHRVMLCWQTLDFVKKGLQLLIPLQLSVGPQKYVDNFLGFFYQ